MPWTSDELTRHVGNVISRIWDPLEPSLGSLETIGIDLHSGALLVFLQPCTPKNKDLP